MASPELEALQKGERVRVFSCRQRFFLHPSLALSQISYVVTMSLSCLFALIIQEFLRTTLAAYAYLDDTFPYVFDDDNNCYRTMPISICYSGASEDIMISDCTSQCEANPSCDGFVKIPNRRRGGFHVELIQDVNQACTNTESGTKLFVKPSVAWFTMSPTASPTAPTSSPTVSPTASPSASPTASPSASPTASPTASPSASPTASPTAAPTTSPTAAPTPAALGRDETVAVSVIGGLCVVSCCFCCVFVLLKRRRRQEQEQVRLQQPQEPQEQLREDTMMSV
eukprot:TRINITY_DN26064_c0_g1_i1.p1 TRINITY_DN26064_c0_g1~~TRINITY_DN26064_c0_g1_i1.p1  ORF type:complete len:310 (-),score=42.59 TRINITY_DN26064_c0_g1_i1:458-1306(-)